MGVKGMPRLANPRIGQWSEIWGNWLIEIIVMIKTSKQASQAIRRNTSQGRCYLQANAGTLTMPAPRRRAGYTRVELSIIQ